MLSSTVSEKACHAGDHQIAPDKRSGARRRASPAASARGVCACCAGEVVAGAGRNGEGRRLDITLTYNSRIDALHSSLHLIGPDGKAQTLAVDGACCAEPAGGEGGRAVGRRVQAGVAGAGQRWPHQPRRRCIPRRLTMRE